MERLGNIFSIIFTVVFSAAMMVAFVLFMALIQLQALRFWGAGI